MTKVKLIVYKNTNDYKINKEQKKEDLEVSKDEMKQYLIKKGCFTTYKLSPLGENFITL